MVDKKYTSEKDISNILRNAFGVCGVKWGIKHPDYDYLGLATCTAEIDSLGISIVAFPRLVGYEAPGVPIYRAHIYSDELNGNSITDELQIALYAEKGINLMEIDGKQYIKKTVDTKKRNKKAANTINITEFKNAIKSVRKAAYNLD